MTPSEDAPASPPRLLIFVIAYYAEPTLRQVLERIPRSIFQEYDCEVLVVDDASEDRTFAIGREYRDAHPDIRMTVLRNPYNRGYGGNQKIGYSYAIVERFDFVAMVHGDGQYAPEELPALVQPLRDGRADAVFGSRTMVRFAALRGGMPLYKYVGNRILTRIQNALLRTDLSEFHSGYRVYSVRALRSIPFRLNTDDFHFDTEIIIQLCNARARILERPIPTHYGSEISRVNGLRYARNVVAATLLNAAHRAGLLHQRRFDARPIDGSDVPPYDLKLGYPSSHSWALEAVPAGATVIDLGSGVDGLARELVRKGCETAVVGRSSPSEPIPGATVLVQPLEAPRLYDVGRYQYLLLLDVIEHLRQPEQFLDELRRQFTYTPKKLILTTPNVAFVVQRLMLLIGQFNYGKAGILDRTHTRLFTFRSLRALLHEAGFRVTRTRGIPAPFPKAVGQGRLASFLLALNLALIRLSRTIFSYQIYVEAESTPDVDFLLAAAKEKSAEAQAHPGADTALKAGGR